LSVSTAELAVKEMVCLIELHHPATIFACHPHHQIIAPFAAARQL